MTWVLKFTFQLWKTHYQLFVFIFSRLAQHLYHHTHSNTWPNSFAIIVHSNETLRDLRDITEPTRLDNKDYEVRANSPVLNSHFKTQIYKINKTDRENVLPISKYWKWLLNRFENRSIVELFATTDYWYDNELIDFEIQQCKIHWILYCS